jgi:hypothetical protein
MTEEEILIELARLHRAVEEKVRRQQRGELFERLEACVADCQQSAGAIREK